MYEFGEYVKAGGLLSYGPSILDVYRKAASYDFDAGFKAMRAADGLLRANAPLFTTHRARLVGLAAKSRLPAMYGQREYVEVGGFMSYGPHQVIE